MRCKICGFRVRGKEHVKGSHHEKGKYSLTDPKKITKYEEAYK